MQFHPTLRRLPMLGALALLAAAAFAPDALAHVTVKQVLLAKDEAPEVTLTVPNEEDASVVTGVTFTADRGFVFLSGEAKPGWQLTVSDQTISWRGGELPPKSYTTFSFRMIAHGNTQMTALRPTYLLKSGEVNNEEEVPLDLGKNIGGGGGTDSSTRDLVYVVAVLAAVAFVAAVTAFFVALRVWLDPSRPADELAQAE